MARPLKKGIDYFSFDVDFFEDEKIEPISGEFGSKGEIIVIRLLCAVYRNGYFILWNEQLKMTLANRCKVSSELVDQVIGRLVKWGFINESLFHSAKVITSKGIQIRFQEATRKRKYDYSKFEYWLLNDKKVVSSAHNQSQEEFLPPETPQSKVKESKVILYIGDQEKIVSDFYYKIRNEMIEDQLTIERLCMNEHLSVGDLVKYIDEFIYKRSSENNTEIQTINDAQTYFHRWLLCELDRKKNNQKGGKNEAKQNNRQQDYSDPM